MNFNTQIKRLERDIARKNKEYDRLKKAEKKANQRWVREYHAHLEAADAWHDLKKLGTKKHERIKQRSAKGKWKARSIELTKARDAIREQLSRADQERGRSSAELSIVKERQKGSIQKEDEIVQRVFEFNKKITDLNRELEEYLVENVYSSLVGVVGPNGKPRTQVSFDSSDQLRRVMALMNRITYVKPDLADRAQQHIERYVQRFQVKLENDPENSALIDFLSQLLIEKKTFKVGPKLYEFLGMKLSRAYQPELVEAQALLKGSIRSDPTKPYKRLWERKSSSDNLQPVPQR